VGGEINEFSQACRVFWVLVAFVCLTLPGRALALGQIRYQNPIEHAVGLHGVTGLIVDPEWAVRPSARLVEAGQRFLFGIPGLVTTQVRVGARRRTLGALVSSTFLSSTIGHEYRVTLEPFLQRERTLFGIALSYQSLSLQPFASVGLATLGVRTCVRLSRSIRLGYSIDNIRLYGIAHPGADTGVYLIIERGVSAIAHARLTRDGAVEMSFASWARIGRVLAIAAGYDDSSGLLKAGVSLRVRPATLSVGASLHPFLGVSKSVFLTWRR